MPLLIRGPTSRTAPSTYTLAPREAIIPESVTATFDGSGAAGAFLPTLSVYAQSGELLARSPATEVAAGSSAEVTFAPLLRAATSAATGGGDFVKLHHETLAADGNFSFPSIPQTFSHLFCIAMGRMDSGNGAARLQFNGDTAAANYGTVTLQAQAAFLIAGDFVAGGIEIQYFPIQFEPAGNAGTHAFWIVAYTGTTFNKQVIDAGGYPGGTPMEYDATLGEWLSTAAITDLALVANAPGFLTGSTFDVYGIS